MLCLDTPAHSECPTVFDTVCIALETYEVCVECCTLKSGTITDMQQHTVADADVLCPALPVLASSSICQEGS